MDGNSRWAMKNKTSKKKAYTKGLDKIKEVIEICLENNINILTVFALSSENTKRPSLKIIFDIILNNIDIFLDYLSKDNKVKVKFFGNHKNIPKKINRILKSIEVSTNNNKQIKLNIAFNYGAKNEIINCFKNLLSNNKKNIQINEKIIRDNLYLTNTPDPDLLIRTGGFQRLSNFLLFQLSYTELFFSSTLWPDFTKNEIVSIFNKFKKIERKFGL